MTEQMAIEWVKKQKVFVNTPEADAQIIVIRALKELEQHRAIGTVEECRDNNDFLEFLYNHIPPNEMEQYLSMYHTKDKVAVNGYADQSGLMPAT